MKRVIVLLIFLFGNFSLETHNLILLERYSSSDDLAILIDNVANHYNQDFWLIKDIFDICLSYDVDPLLMVSLIKVESNFVPTALSRKNAYGYCQITSIANKDIDPKLNRYNKRDNIILGVRFISKLLKLFEGNIENSLRYYNAGNDYNKKGQSYAENIKYEYRMLNMLYVKNQISYGKIYRKETF